MCGRVGILTFTSMYRVVWPVAKIFLCLWHVRKVWAENAVKKISTVGERATVLQMVGDVMYGKGCGVDDDPIDWALQQLDFITNTRPRSAAFMRYMNDNWSAKAAMWCVGARRIPHAGQNTNATIESYHSNLKSILNSTKERFIGRRMDWLIYHLIGDVLTHYWYGVQCKAFGFVRNKQHEGIVCSAIIRASTIPDTNVLICMDEDVAYVGSVNNRPKVWTIHSPDSEWAQCDCPVAQQGMICKHTMKVFKMLHPDIHDGVIVREAGTMHGVDRATPMSQCYSKARRGLLNERLAGDNSTHSKDNSNNDCVDLEAETIGAPFADVLDICSQISIGSVSNPIDLSQSDLAQSQTMPRTTADNLYTSLTKNVETYPMLGAYLIADLKHIHGKQTELIARGDAMLHPSSSPLSFPARGGDNSLKRHRSFLENTPSKKKTSYT